MTRRCGWQPSASGVRHWAIGIAVLLLPSVVSAQGRAWPGRVVVAANGALQASSTTFNDRFSFDQYLEQATVETAYEVKSAPTFDGGVIVRVWRGLGAGVSVSRFTDRQPARIDGNIPHPFVFSTLRHIDGRENVRRSETGAHVQLAWMIPATDSIRFILSAGPSWLSVEQSLVQEVRFAETYPFDTAEYSSATIVRESTSAVGYNAGADVIWMFSKSVGVGGLLRFTRATMTMQPGEGRSVRIEAGGLHAGGGLRVLF